MHLKGLNLNLLVVLDALLREKSVTKTAERLNVTQPAISAALQRLREYLDDPLLERNGRKVELTQRARDLAVPVREILLRIESALNTTPNFNPAEDKRTFRVAMSAHMAELVGVPLVRYLIGHAPGISFQIVDLAVDSFKRVEEGDLDLCLTISERVLENPVNDVSNLQSEHLFFDNFTIVASRDNTVLKSTITYDEFCDQPYVELLFNGNFRSLPDIVLSGQEKRPTVNAWMQTSQNVLAAVGSTKAVAIVPTRLYELHKETLRLRKIAPPISLPRIEQRCFWHKRNDIDSGHRWFRQTLTMIANSDSDKSAKLPDLQAA
ncbi:DNA-binding transcriptional LysR family regulator [Sphingopyxis panaciterrae]|uniref:LysR family transcriptional regulator n=1 Tax=Sphingopyxis panaciterrae TaxID=363841 RepID=UPI001423F272|nr:LysR family transcriptional regulator [Sphingopyxis panaciterrae]NIJ37626.1 DNA-binding transcriptional LysR family regulator [Sphingopyxis panaciterrae]